MTARRPDAQSVPTASLAVVAIACAIGAFATTLATPPGRRATPRTRVAAPPLAGGIDTAAATARAFVDGYLAWTRGRGSARRIPGAGHDLHKRLNAETVRASRVSRRRVLRIAELHTHLLTPQSGTASARVLDGDTAFTVTLTLGYEQGRWVISDVA
jgi:hypothetical protein